MKDTKPRWTPPNWPKGFVEVCDQLGIRIAQPDDPIYQNASWRISLVSRPQWVEAEKQKDEPKEQQGRKEEA